MWLEKRISKISCPHFQPIPSSGNLKMWNNYECNGSANLWRFLSSGVSPAVTILCSQVRKYYQPVCDPPYRLIAPSAENGCDHGEFYWRYEPNCITFPGSAGTFELLWLHETICHSTLKLWMLRQKAFIQNQSCFRNASRLLWTSHCAFFDMHAWLCVYVCVREKDIATSTGQGTIPTTCLTLPPKDEAASTTKTSSRPKCSASILAAARPAKPPPTTTALYLSMPSSLVSPIPKGFKPTLGLGLLYSMCCASRMMHSENG